MSEAYRLWCDPAVLEQFHRLDIPYAEQQNEILLRLLPFARTEPLRILDVGCGGAALLADLLDLFPGATGVGVDLSEPMLALARQRLASLSDRSHLVQADIAVEGWDRACGESFDLIVSRYAIHHIADAAKRAVYTRCFHLLRTPGMFINIEHVASPGLRVEALSERLFVDTLHAAAMARGEGASRQDIEQQFHERPDKAANILAPVERQLTWLREIGFIDVDCFWKCFELAILGGSKRSEMPIVGTV